ncbi:MAG: glucosaminidase domain-containing protein [Bacteroidota bacterium]
MRRGTYHHHQSLQKEVEYTILDHLTFQLLFRKLLQHFRKLMTVAQFCFHRLTFGAFHQYKISWFQLTVIAFAVFIFVKKDFQFQIRMKAPSASSSAIPTASNAEQMSLAPSIPWLSTSSSTTEISAVGLPMPQLERTQVEAYIKRFAKVAIMEQQKFGIPASIKMAQGLLESQAGQASLTQQTNNHFGKIFNSESFGSAWESWRAHSQMIVHENSKYRSLLRYGKDYKSWAAGLESLNYSDYANYGKALTQLIEQYEIFRLDGMKL